MPAVGKIMMSETDFSPQDAYGLEKGTDLKE